ncbi:MAG TPA: hypothetical protein VMF90_11275 [Rhizobiaceae bacterium]|nr:hypothetical protein [Rhizobiaceae bacterium]
MSVDKGLPANLLPKVSVSVRPRGGKFRDPVTDNHVAPLHCRQLIWSGGEIEFGNTPQDISEFLAQELEFLRLLPARHT